MSFVDGYFERNTDTVYIVEKVNGQRVFKEYPADYSFYIPDPRGNYRSLYGEPLKKIVPKTNAEKVSLVKQYSHVKKYESDVKPLFRALEQYYAGTALPTLNKAFFDIETDFDPVMGYSSPNDALNKILSVSIYLDWMEQMFCFSLYPPELTREEAQLIADEVGDTVIFDTEREMLEAFITVIEDADVLTGWNSTFFDIPYVVNRISRIMGKQETRKLGLWNELPIKRNVTNSGRESITYELAGRVHVDYMDLYKKYAYEEKSSYALNAIAEAELGEKKVEYDGSLDELYHLDFRKFLEYNIHDTRLLYLLDKKLKYIELVNGIAHECCVPIPTTQGAVATTEQAIMMQAHSQGLICPNKFEVKEEDVPAAGGWVGVPKKGFNYWVASVDLNSLYPSVIRTLNMSPETIIAQINTEDLDNEIRAYLAQGKNRSVADWWNEKFHIPDMDYFYKNDNETKLRVDFENGVSKHMTGKEIRDLILSSNVCISANGTLFRTDIDGTIPTLLTRWYSERKQTQDISKGIEKIAHGVTLPEELANIQIPQCEKTVDLSKFSDRSLEKAISTGGEEFIDFCSKFGLVNHNGILKYHDVAAAKLAYDYWDRQQLIKKVMLNSLYGGLLNAGNRFADKRLGQSTTLTGRTISKHMSSKINELIAGVYDIYGESFVYSDTDSCYFTAYPTLRPLIESGEYSWDKEIALELYDSLVPDLNDSFPIFLKEHLGVPVERSTGVIKAGREIVSTCAIFSNKKKYAALMYDKEGNRYDVDGKPGKVKATGLDLRRSDTTKEIQKFLSEVLMDALTGQGEHYVLGKIRKYKEHYASLKPWQKGAPKAVKGITKYNTLKEEHLAAKIKGNPTKAPAVPGHVQAAMNWNRMLEIYSDMKTMKITDGCKVVVCKLKHNPYQMNSIAYPVDCPVLPTWFEEMPFDEEEMEELSIDNKLKNMLGCLNWDFDSTSKGHTILSDLFDF